MKNIFRICDLQVGLVMLETLVGGLVIMNSVDIHNLVVSATSIVLFFS